ncbi:MAG: TetR/AcrR family transcriptional regulator [Haloferacaceae archaeon]
MDADTSAGIMEATHRALCEHGYADLTMQRIADESTMTKAALHYHFDTKEDLLNAFLDDLLARFEERLACDASDPHERLAAFLEAVFAPVDESDGDDDFAVALMELKAQAPYHETYRQRFLELDERMHDVVASAVRDGVEAGTFAEEDPGEVARFVVTVINGSHARKVALGENPTETRRIIEHYLATTVGWTSGVAA